MFKKIIYLLNFLVYLSASPSGNFIKINDDVLLDEFSERIVGGMPAEIEEFPFLVHLLRSGASWCGGSLIGPKTVLTAAHCVTPSLLKNHPLTARVGSSLSNRGGIVIPVIKIITHPLHRSESYVDYDIAILELLFDATSTGLAQVIQLWDENVQFRAGTPAIIAGFGKLLEGTNHRVSRYLMKAVVPIFDLETCKSLYLNQLPNYASSSSVKDRNICAGYMTGKHDTCQGDSGGPLIVDNKLAGIVSFGKGCGRPRFPGVYSSVPVYRNWIRNTVFI